MDLSRQNPEIVRLYQLYRDCRTEQMFAVKMPKQGGSSSVLKILPFPSGYHTLPNAGGMLDQPYRTMEFFSAFKAGELKAFHKRLSE